MSVDLDQIIALNRQILAGLAMRESKISEREADARKALEQALKLCAEEKAKILQDRESLAQTEALYRGFLNAQAANEPPPRPAPPPVALTVVASSEPVEVPEQAPSEGAMAGAELSTTIDNLRVKVAQEYQNEEAAAQSGGTRRWQGMWR